MIENHVYSNWDSPPDIMSFELRFSELLSDVERTVEQAIHATVRDSRFYDNMLALYVRTQAIPSVLLNYKICIEFGLPLHPTKYFDFNSEEKDSNAYSPNTRKLARQFFLDSLSIAKDIYRLEPGVPTRLASLRDRLPEFLSGFLYTNTKDQYTWRASNPDSVRSLAESIQDEIQGVDLVLGAAHGSIRPAILLSNLLDSELYLLRYSTFKRDDRSPIVSDTDMAFLDSFRHKRVLLFDEDIAKGSTLGSFQSLLGSHLEHAYTGAVLRHYLASFRPDFVGEVSYD